MDGQSYSQSHNSYDENDQYDDDEYGYTSRYYRSKSEKCFQVGFSEHSDRKEDINSIKPERYSYKTGRYSDRRDRRDKFHENDNKGEHEVYSSRTSKHTVKEEKYTGEEDVHSGKSCKDQYGNYSSSTSDYTDERDSITHVPNDNKYDYVTREETIEKRSREKHLYATNSEHSNER